MQSSFAAPSWPIDLIGSSRRQIDDSRKLIQEVTTGAIGRSRDRVERTEARISRSMTLLLETGIRTAKN